MVLEYFPCYHSYLARLAKLSDQEVGRLFRALLTYSATGERQELTGRENVAFDFIQFDIDLAKENFEKKCHQNTENVKKRWNANNTPVYDRIRSDTNNTKAKAKAKANISPVLPSGNTAPLQGDTTARRFAPPTVEEVNAYCQERGNRVDAAHFVDYYTANGWRVGKNPMKDWKAAVRTWEKKADDSAKPQKPSPSASQRNAARNAQFATAESPLSDLEREAIRRSLEDGKT